MEQVQAQEDPRKPEGYHWYPAEERAFGVAAEPGTLDAYEPDETA